MRISSRRGWQTQPLIRGRIHLRKPKTPSNSLQPRADHTFSQHFLKRRHVQHLLRQRCSRETPHWGLFFSLQLFSLAFSASRVFSRRASDASMPPYLARHLKNVASLIPLFATIDPLNRLLYAPTPAQLLRAKPSLGFLQDASSRQIGFTNRLPGNE